MKTDYPPKPQNAGGPDSPGVSDESVRAGHEKKDVNVAGLTLFFAGLVVMLAATFVGIALLFRIFGAVDAYTDKGVARHETGGASQVRLLPDYHGPILQIVPEEDLKGMNRSNDVALEDYGWIDRNAGTVRLPIDRAITLVAERGLPSVSPGQTVESIQQRRADPQVYGQSLRP